MVGLCFARKCSSQNPARHSEMTHSSAMDIIEQKKEIRRRIRLLKPNLRNEDYMAFGRQLAQTLTDRDDVKAAGVIVAYWPLIDELNTGPFIMECVKRGKHVYLPVIKGHDLVFKEFTGYKCLAREPRFGILEPQGTAELDICGSGDGVIMIAPGMAFTTEGARLGRGRGFYDRAFATLVKAKKIGVCYKCQVVQELPTEEHDAKMDSVVAI